MPLPGGSEIAGVLLLNYGATNTTSAQKKPIYPLVEEEDRISKH
jgi:hypothetical protein